MTLDRTVMAYVTRNSVYEVDHTGPGWLWRKKGDTWTPSGNIAVKDGRLCILGETEGFTRTSVIVAGPINVTGADLVGWIGNHDDRPLTVEAVQCMIGAVVPFTAPGLDWLRPMARAEVLDARLTEGPHSRVIVALALNRPLPADYEFFKHGYPLPRLNAGFAVLRSNPPPFGSKDPVTPITAVQLSCLSGAHAPQSDYWHHPAKV